MATTVVAVVASVVMAVVWRPGCSRPTRTYARNPYGIGWRILLLAAITLAVVATVFAGAARLLKRAGPGHRPSPPARSSWSPLLALLTGAAVPALSYVFLWPAVAGVRCLRGKLLRPDTARRAVGRQPVRSPWVAVVVATVGVPLVYLLASAASVVTCRCSPLSIAVFIALLASVLVPHFRYL